MTRLREELNLIKIESNKPDEFNFLCSNQEEVLWLSDHKDKIFDKFVRERTNNEFDSMEKYLEWMYDTPVGEFCEAAIKAKMEKEKTLNMDWNYTSIAALEEMFNKEFRIYNRAITARP